jgi:hypothetical protein
MYGRIALQNEGLSLSPTQHQIASGLGMVTLARNVCRVRSANRESGAQIAP